MGLQEVKQQDRKANAISKMKSSEFGEVVAAAAERQSAVNEKLSSLNIKNPCSIPISALPYGTRQVDRSPQSSAWQMPWKKELVLVVSSLAVYEGKLWHHISFSRANKMPPYSLMCLVKKNWIGPDAQAVQVFAPESEHVNRHPYCLHLWACLEGPQLPDFRVLGEI